MTGQMRTGTIEGARFGPTWGTFIIEWEGTEMAGGYGRAGLKLERLPLLAVEGRVIRLRRLVARLAGEDAYLVASDWHAERGWAITLRGLHGSARHRSSLAGPRRVLGGLELIARVDRDRGRRPEREARIAAIEEAAADLGTAANRLRVAQRLGRVDAETGSEEHGDYKRDVTAAGGWDAIMKRVRAAQQK